MPGADVTFETLPLVHLENGRLPDVATPPMEEALTMLARRFGRVVLVDVAGVRRNVAELETIQALARKRSLWIDGGSRYATDAMDLFIAGAETVTMRWNTLHRPDELEEAASLCQPESLFVALEFPNGEFLTHRKDERNAEAVVRYAEELGIGVVFIVESADVSFLRRLPPGRTPRYLAGPLVGVDIEQLQGMGFVGVAVPASSLPPEASA